MFVFDEPSIGLHPLDVQVLLGVFQALLDNGATVIVIEHDLDVIRNADFVIDMSPRRWRGRRQDRCRWDPAGNQRGQRQPHRQISVKFQKGRAGIKSAPPFFVICDIFLPAVSKRFPQPHRHL